MDHLLDLFVAGRQREHAAEELDFFEAQVFGVIESHIDGESSQRINLDPEFETGCFGLLGHEPCDGV